MNGHQPTESIVNSVAGLDGVVVAETRLSDVRGEDGQLIVRGYPIEDIVKKHAFEETWALLWTGHPPDTPTAAEYRRRIAAGRVDGFQLLSRIGDALSLPDAMDTL